MSFEVTSYSIHRSSAKIKKMLLCNSLNKNLITKQSVILFKDSFLGYVFLVSSYKILGCIVLEMFTELSRICRVCRRRKL